MKSVSKGKEMLGRFYMAWNSLFNNSNCIISLNFKGSKLKCLTCTVSHLKKPHIREEVVITMCYNVVCNGRLMSSSYTTHSCRLLPSSQLIKARKIWYIFYTFSYMSEFLLISKGTTFTRQNTHTQTFKKCQEKFAINQNLTLAFYVQTYNHIFNGNGITVTEN